MSLLSVTNIIKKHGDEVVVNDVSFEQGRLQKIGIAGETGSGKTTLMKIIAGLGQADSGEVLFEGKKVKGVFDKLMPGHPGIAYLSQHFELNNNYRVEEMLNYANNLTAEESAMLIEVCRIGHLQKRLTQTLSGGEKQRVALAKLLTHTPRLLLLDEPFSNMDLIHRNILKGVIDDVSERLGITCMLISHEPDDLLPWADELFVMHQGNIIQRGAPREIYHHPINEYAAGLLGKYTQLTPELLALLPAINRETYIRPESVTLTPYESNGIKGTITKVAYLGSHYELEIAIGSQVCFLRTERPGFKKGDAVNVKL